MGANGLTSLLYFLAFGLFFYWMMKKGGCGMHAHGGHGHAGDGNDAPAGPDAQHAGVSGSTKDPVCGMPLDPKRAVGMRTVRDLTFYFCSADCLAKFDADPEDVASRAPVEAPRAESGHHHHHGH